MIEINENIEPGKQARRWCFTINNPFGTIEEINPAISNLPYKEDYYPKKIMLELEESDCFVFKYVKVSIGEDEFETKDYIVRRPFFKDLDHAYKYLENIEHVKYFIFQIEKGENEQTEHIQGFISFNIGKRFKTIKDALPFAHIEKAMGTNTQCRDYCSKTDTRVSGPYEYGQFAEERERTDIRDFIDLIKSGASKNDLCTLYPSLYLKSGHRVDAIYSTQFEKYQTQCRDVKVTYIYGPSGVGKTSKIRRELGLENAFWVHNYDNSMFTNYKNQDTLVFDEYCGDIKIPQLNQYLNINPIQLRGLNCVKYGAYHNVYIISNFAPQELYKDIQRTSPQIFATFMRRLHTIIYIDRNGVEHIKRKTIWTAQTNEEDLKLGSKEQIQRVIDIDENGNEVIIFDIDIKL